MAIKFETEPGTTTEDKKHVRPSKLLTRDQLDKDDRKLIKSKTDMGVEKEAQKLENSQTHLVRTEKSSSITGVRQDQGTENDDIPTTVGTVKSNVPEEPEKKPDGNFP